MKHRIGIAALVCAVLLLGALAALAGDVPAAPDPNAAARAIALDAGEYEQRVLFLLDENGLPARVMERFGFERPATDEEQRAIAANYEIAPGLSANGQTVYALWTDAEIARTFGGLDAETFGQFLAALESGEAVYQTTELAHTLYRGGQFTLALDALHFSPCFGLTLSCTAVNGYKATAVNVLLSECAVDGLCLPLEMAGPVNVAPGESVSFLVPVADEAADMLYALGVESVGEIAVRYRVLDAENETVKAALSQSVAVSGLSGATAPVSMGEPLYDGQGLRVYSLGLDEATGRAALLFEKTDDAAWRALRVDAVFDGEQAYCGTELRLENGQRAVRTFAANRPVSGADFYCTPDYVSSLQAPVRLTLGSPAPLAERANEDAPLWKAGACEVRFAGVSDEVFSDSDALLFECVNRSGSETVWLYPAYGYVYLDGNRMRAKTVSAACYPGSRCTVAVAVNNLGAPDLSACETLEVTLGLYTLEGTYLERQHKSEGLRVALR